MGGLERGQRNPSLTTIARVAGGLDMTMGDLLTAIEADPADSANSLLDG
jgi:transcriptional regulator with XRE-family HTH domain